MRIDAGLDTGDILLAADTEIKPDETSVELSERLSHMGAALLVLTLAGLENGTIEPEPQDSDLATHAPIIKKQDAVIDFRLPAPAIHNLVRGMQPWPGAHTTFRGQLLHLWRTSLTGTVTDLAPGTLVVDKGLHVVTGGGRLLQLLEVQAEGRKRVDGTAFANGQRLTHREMLGNS